MEGVDADAHPATTRCRQLIQTDLALHPSIHCGVFNTKKPEGKVNRDLQLLQTILCLWKTSVLTVSGGLNVFKASNWKAIFESLLLSELKVM